MRIGSILLVTLALAGCKSHRDPPPTTPTSAVQPCREGVSDNVRMAGRTAGAAAKTGVTTASDAVVQAGSSAAGLIEGGTNEAGERWRKGGNQTRSTANQGAGETREEASIPPCK